MIYFLLIMAVLGGAIIARLIKGTNPTNLGLLLAFSGSYLLGVTLFDLLPISYSSLGQNTGLWIVIGLLLQLILDFLTKGAEHGHIHLEKEDFSFPWLLFIGLSIHALIEGFPATLDQNLLMAIIIHKVPVAVILALFFLQSGYKWSTALSFMALFALMSPIGSYLASETDMFIRFADQINAMSAGIFLHVATTILFESSRNHQFNLKKLIVIIAGFLFAFMPQYL